MFADTRQMISQTQYYWRTISLIFVLGIAIASLSRDPIAVLLSTFLGAFAFSGFERRKWIVVAPRVYATDVMLRVIVCTFWSYTICMTEFGHLLLTSLG